ncbi:exported oxidase [Caballeronia catudaia]|uniref:Exported oxidase n=1 Tax=Caballeronia catudaia TaxID=1777136 RepID=A0A158C2F8_9BURK|nr:kelch repeat-containing protein [Caballeronia catudaia]SAK76430.1 exported oxidase [Caballeronia catudaia]
MIDQSGAGAPSGLAYAIPSAIYTVGTPIVRNAPSSSGGAITHYSISPALPAGLSLDGTSGVIDGAPSAVSTAATYTISAFNDKGEATARVQIEVKAAATAPESLIYQNVDAVYFTGQPIARNVPLTTGGAVSLFTISPALPAGLALDPATGALGGTPTTVTPPAEYTITAANTAGSVKATVRLEVRAATSAPSTLRYATVEPVYVAGQVIGANLPVVTGGEIKTFSVSPALPDGLSLNGQTGAITGTPKSSTAQADYVITGSNAAGAIQTHVKITVVAIPEGAWQPTGSLERANANHEAILLSSGKVLVIGGTSASELYDPARGAWTLVATMLPSRARFTATLLSNGKLLVAGGRSGDDGEATAWATVFDPATGAWSYTGKMNHPRAAASATLLPNGKVLVAGGYDYDVYQNKTTYVAEAELYDPVSGTWTVTGSLKNPRAYHAAALIAGNKVLVAGGKVASTTTITAETYDVASGVWTSTDEMKAARSSPTMTVLGNGKILVAGGSDSKSAELFDPSSGQWTLTPPMVTRRIGSRAVLLPNGRVLVTGTLATVGDGTSTEIYDPASGAWVAAAHTSVERYGHSATLLPDGSVLVAGSATGGINDIFLLSSSAELFR